MALSDREYIRVPPDGAGKALVTGHIHHVEYTGGSLGFFLTGQTVVGATSGTEGIVSDVVEKTATSGHMNLRFAKEDEAVSFTIGEDLEVDGVVGAQVSAQEHYQVGQSQLVGKNNPRFGQNVDVEGAASVRFVDGSPNFDPAGRAEVSSENWIGIYSQSTDEQSDLIYAWTVGAGAVAYDENSHTTELQVDDANGSSVIRQTHLYHHYRAGVPMSATMTIAAGAAIDGCVRRWGYFDENDGMFFEYDGTTIYVVARSSANGSVTEIRVPQSDWNGDRLDGSGDISFNPSQVTLNIEDFWLYDISFLYLGAGPAKFAVYVGGKRTTVHTFFNGGETPYPFMRTGSLPLRWEIENTQATTGPTQLRQGNSTVYSHGDWAPQEKIYGSNFREPVTVNAPTAVAVIRAKQTMQSGRDNRAIVMPSELRIMSTAEPIHIKLTRGGTFDINGWFSEFPESLLEQGVYNSTPGDFNTAGPPDILTDGRVVYSHLVVPGEVGYIDLTKSFSVRADGEIRRDADITQADLHAVIVQSVNGNPTDVTLSFTWREIS